jgi:hypothetical protein
MRRAVLDGGREITHEALRVAVTLVESEPRRRDGLPCQPLRCEGRLAEAGRGGHQSDPVLLDGVVEPIEEPASLHELGPAGRPAEFGADEHRIGPAPFPTRAPHEAANIHGIRGRVHDLHPRSMMGRPDANPGPFGGRFLLAGESSGSEHENEHGREKRKDAWRPWVSRIVTLLFLPASGEVGENSLHENALPVPLPRSVRPNL